MLHMITSSSHDLGVVSGDSSVFLPKASTLITTGSPSAKMIFFKEHPANCSEITLPQPEVMVTSSRLVQPMKTPLPTLVTVVGIGLVVSEVQPLKQLRPMVTQVLGS